MLSVLELFSWSMRLSGPVMRQSIHHTSSPPPGLLQAITECVPQLTSNLHKGESGRVAVIGGCDEYTGAPYYAAISSLRTGADLATVYCTTSAGLGIKSYSPELMVAPYLSAGVNKIIHAIPRSHCFVVGPGLGRDTDNIAAVQDILTAIMEEKKPVIIDADALHVITMSPELMCKYNKAILTPNAAEFVRLYRKVIQADPIPGEPVINVKRLAEAMTVTIVHKGQQDIISDGVNVLICTAEGSPRRNGGQGDMLAGMMAIFSHWMHEAMKESKKPSQLKLYGPNIMAAFAACTLQRECSKRAYSIHGRSLITSDIIDIIGASFQKLYER